MLSPLIDVTQTPAMFGFVDEDHLAIARERLTWCSAPTYHEDWPLTAPTLVSLPQVDRTAKAVIGDGALVSASLGSLVLATPSGVHWLGHRVLSEAPFAGDGAGHFVLGPAAGQLIWLDEKLQQTRAFELPAAIGTTSVVGTALDASHVLVQHISNGETGSTCTIPIARIIRCTSRRRTTTVASCSTSSAGSSRSRTSGARISISWSRRSCA